MSSLPGAVRHDKAGVRFLDSPRRREAAGGNGMKFLQFSPREQCTKFPVAMAVTSRAEIYRTKALQCEQEGARAAAPALKRKYRNLAQQWREMAEQAERAAVRRPKEFSRLNVSVRRRRGRGIGPAHPRNRRRQAAGRCDRARQSILPFLLDQPSTCPMVLCPAVRRRPFRSLDSAACTQQQPAGQLAAKA